MAPKYIAPGGSQFPQNYNELDDNVAANAALGERTNKKAKAALLSVPEYTALTHLGATTYMALFINMGLSATVLVFTRHLHLARCKF